MTNILFFSDWKQRLRPYQQVSTAIDLWTLAVQQAYSAIQTCRVYFDWCDACQMDVNSFFIEAHTFWLNEFYERSTHCEKALEQRERMRR